VAGEQYSNRECLVKKSMNGKKKIKTVFIVLAFICLSCTFIAGLLVGKNRGIPFVKKQEGWSIGIYVGESPLKIFSPMNVKNPVLTAIDVTDVAADYVADPFMVRENDKWYMFFEVMRSGNRQGKIGFATSDDGFSWTYKRIVIDEPFHLSYPYVFKWKDDYFMVPESVQARSLRLYKATRFPTEWSFVKSLVNDVAYSDPSIVRYQDRWWIFASPTDDVLRLFSAPDLFGRWTEHPRSPLISGDSRIARPGGRVIEFNGGLLRYAQDDSSAYGYGVRAFAITEMTSSSYKEKEVEGNPIIKASGNGWNAKGMHTIDPHQLEANKWIACVDGNGHTLHFGLKY
jgi:hypothetical protein